MRIQVAKIKSSQFFDVALGCLLFGFLLLSLCYPLSKTIFLEHGLYNIKRIVEILLLNGILVILILYPKALSDFLKRFQGLPTFAKVGILFIFISGLISTYFAKHQYYALLEWGQFFQLFIFSLIIATLLAKPYGKKIHIAFVISAVSLYVLVYLYTWLGHIFIDSEYFKFYVNRMPGFINVRFFSQFQIWFIGLLPALYLGAKTKKGTVLIGLLGILNWSMAWLNYSIGMLVSVGVVLVVISLFCFQKRYILVQTTWLVLGFLLSFGLAEPIKSIHPISKIEHNTTQTEIVTKSPQSAAVNPKKDKEVVADKKTSRIESSIFSRLHLIERAFELSNQNVFIGVGPMHYASVMNPVGTHPHNMIMMILAEWGWPVTLVLLLMIALGVRGYIRKLRQEHDIINYSVLVSFLMGLSYAQVSGVIVMPLGQIMFFYSVGAMLSSQRSAKQQQLSMWLKNLALIILMSLIFISVYELVTRYSTLTASSFAWFYQHQMRFLPRYWLQGWI